MRTLFLIQSPSLPSSRVRVLDLRADLEAEGISVEVRTYPRSMPERWRVWTQCPRYDAVIVQKKLPTWIDSVLLRSRCRRLVYDFDDAVYYRHDDRRGHDHATGRRRFRSLIRRVDLAVAGNRFLAEAARGRARRVEILPSAVETRGVPLREHVERPDPLVIGWVGGAINLGYAASLGPVLRTLSGEFPLEYRIICSEGLSIEGVRTTFVPWSAATQAAEIARFDIGVMPLPKTPHAEGKCAYKALQYMAGGVPPVVSDVGVNREVVGEGGLAAADPGEFLSHLRRLAGDASLRRELGARARLRVERSYSVQVVARRFAGLLRSLATGPGTGDGSPVP